METNKQFMVYDRSGRSERPYNLGFNDLMANWDLAEQDDNLEQTLEDYLNESEYGDIWESNTIKIICTNL